MISGATSPRPATLDELLGQDLAGRLNALDVFSRRMLSGTLPGERRSKRRGRSVEFDDFRDYVPGDDLRHIDWNVLARLDRLFVKLFREEEDLALHLVIDRSASMDAGEPSKLVFAHRVAMALAYVGVVKQNRVSVATISAPRAGSESGPGPGVGSGSGLRQLSPVRGRASVSRIAEFLLESLREPIDTGAADLSRGLLAFARHARGRGIAVILSDCLGEGSITPGLSALAASGPGGFDAYLLHVLSPGELDPAKERARGLVGDLQLTDVETGARAEVTLSAALLARYRERVRGFVERVKRDCRARGIAYFLTPSDTPAGTLVLNSLRRGGMLR